MQNLPLFYYPTKWLWIDDDPIILTSMTYAFGEENCIQTFQSPKICLNTLRDYQPPLFRKNFLKSNTQDEGYGVLKHTPTDFDVTTIVNLADDQSRYEEITVMVIDYSMPEMDGFLLAQKIDYLPIQKVLLTGKADENQVITGFNSNLIQRFIQKSEIKMAEKLSTYLRELSVDYFRKITLPLLIHLETEAKLPLSDPIFIKFFENYCSEYKIKEYYLVDKQGSFLCIDNKGKRSCLIVHSDLSIESWLALYEEEPYLPSIELQNIKNRKKIPFFGIGREAWQADPAEWHTSLYTPKILKGRERYLWSRIA